jgi:hypothetical protein
MHRTESNRTLGASALSGPGAASPGGAIPPEVCETCFSDLVQPIDAKASSTGTVRLTLRCPECQHLRIGECTWEEAREFGRHFARGKASLRRHYEKLADENLRDEVDCLVVALHADLIGPDDFRPYRYSA